MSNVDKLKYNGVEYDLGKSIDASLTQSGQPADAKVVGEALNSKIDKVDGKGLSSNDYTTDEKTKLASIENGANKTLIDTTLANTGQAADAKSVGDAIASQNTNINTIKERTDNVEGNITTLQNNKVDKTTPLLNFDDTATDPLTDDGALANALTALNVLDDVIPSGGGALYLKKVLTTALEEIKTLKNHSRPILWKSISRTNVSQASGPNYWNVGDFPPITGYTRFVLDMRPSNNNIVATRWALNDQGTLIVYTYNLASTSQTFDLNAYCVYIKSSEQ